MSARRPSTTEYETVVPVGNFRPTKVRIAFGIALAALSGAGILLSRDVSQVEHTARRVFGAQAVGKRLNDLLRLCDSVGAFRGYAPDAVQLHRDSVESIQAAVRDVRQGIAENPDQQKRIESLEGVIDQAIALQQWRQEVAAEEGAAAADAAYHEGRGDLLYDRMRQLMSDMKSTEESLLRRKKEALDLRTRQARNVFCASAVLGFVILLAVYSYLEREIRRRQRSESRLIHLNRLYAFLSRANQAIVRSRTRDESLREICRVAVEHGQFAMAWIGTPESGSGLIRPIAWWGREDGYLQNVRLYFAGRNVPRLAGTVQTTLDVRGVRNSIESESESLMPWRHEALRRGFRSCAVLPIRLQDRPYGILGLYASHPGFFDDETLRLLEEVASGVSFALCTLDQEEQRRIAETEIRRLNLELKGRVLERTSQLGDANGRLATQNEELARANRMKREFLARMSHEFRTPLNSIIGFTDLLAEQAEGPIGEAYAEYVRHVHHGAHHLLALVSDVLDLSRIEAGRIDLRHEAFAPAEAVSEVLAVIGPLAGARKLDLCSDVSPALVVCGDRTRFKQILYNLLSNAVKFTPAGGSVRVTAESDYGEIRFCVSDTGLGIPPEQHAAIFEEFTQAAPAASGVKEGAGLGLTVTKRIVEMHGGRIWLKSAGGEGSRFFFTMPAAHAGEQAPKRLSSSTA